MQVSRLYPYWIGRLSYADVAFAVSSHRWGKCCIPAYLFIEMVASLFAIDLPGNQPGVIGPPNKPITPGFSLVSKGKSKSGRPRKTFGNMRFYEFLYVFMRSPITF